MKDAECVESNDKSCIRFFIFRVMVIFVLKTAIFDEDKNRKIDFSFVSTHTATLMKIEAKLRWGGGGLHILSWDRAYIYMKYLIFVLFVQILIELEVFA